MTKHFWIYTHNFTHSGAPLVMASIARELAAAGWREQLRVVSWGGLHDRRHSTLQHELALDGICYQIIDLQQKPPRISRGDRLLLNSLALPEAVIQQALRWLGNKQLDRLDWYCHEGNPEVFFSGRELHEKIVQALLTGRLQIRVPSAHTLNHYQKWLKYSESSLAVQIPKVEIPDALLCSAPRKFSELRLHLTGAVGAGQKGHLWFLNLVKEVLDVTPQNTPGFRNIYLQFVGIEEGMYAALARVVCLRASNLLGDYFSWKGQCSKEKCLSIMSSCNLSVNCSLSETFSLVSAESMALGQPVLRNRTGGWNEQLISGKTGFDLGMQVPAPNATHVNLLQSMRDMNQFTDDDFVKLSQAASSHAKRFRHIKYCDWLD